MIFSRTGNKIRIAIQNRNYSNAFPPNFIIKLLFKSFDNDLVNENKINWYLIVIFQNL